MDVTKKNLEQAAAENIISFQLSRQKHFTII
jgi:hypothetical protein